MKKLIGILLMIAMTASMVACSTSSNESKDTSKTVSSKAASVVSEPDSSTDSTNPESSEVSSEASMSDSGTLGDCEVSILSARKSSDYEGNPVIVVKYSFTNNAAENKAFLTATMTKAFQNGVQIDTAMIDITKDTEYDSGASLKELQPGATLEIEIGYVLTDETNPVEVNVQEFSFTASESLKKTFDVTTLV